MTFPLGGEPEGFACTSVGPPRGCAVQRLDALFLPNVGLRAMFE